MTEYAIDLTEFQFMASSGGYAGQKILSDTTALLCLILLYTALSDDAWLGAFLDGLTPTEREEVDRDVSLAISEIMENQIMTLPRYQYLYSWAFEPISPTTVVRGYSSSAYNGQYIWTNSNADGDGIYVPIQLKAGDYKAYFNYNTSPVGGEIYPEIWDGFESLDVSLSEFDTYSASGSYNNQIVRTFTITDDIPEGYLKIGVQTSPSNGSARSLTLQEVIIVGV